VDLVDRLLRSDEPSIRLQVRQGVQGATEAEVAHMREQVRRSSRVATLLSERGADGTIRAHPYRAKWYGAHWVLVTLAELGYPAGDEALIPLREQVLDWLFSSDYLGSLGRVHGLPRLHGSIEGNALWAMLRLGLADKRAEALAERLCDAQWPDGGWNCDRKASGRCSSFTESLIPLRALHLHAQTRSDARSAAAVGEAAEFFLRRRLYRRLRDGSLINPAFVHCATRATGTTTSCSHSWSSPRLGRSVTSDAAMRSTCWRESGCRMGDSLPSTVTTGPPGRWCRASGRFWTGVVSAAAISTPGCPRVSLSSYIALAARWTAPSILPKSDA
jgi:hypothetical protein